MYRTAKHMDHITSETYNVIQKGQINVLKYPTFNRCYGHNTYGRLDMNCYNFFNRVSNSRKSVFYLKFVAFKNLFM